MLPANAPAARAVASADGATAGAPCVNVHTKQPPIAERGGSAGSPPMGSLCVASG